MLDKELVLATAIDLVSGKLINIQREFDALQESLLSQTKSSAGDKHETGRAMAQLEQEKLSRQLTETRKSLEGFKQIDPKKEFTQVAYGSLVITNPLYPSELVKLRLKTRLSSASLQEVRLGKTFLIRPKAIPLK